MKFLEPTITCLMTIHNKPTVLDALEAFFSQTRITDVALIIIDSGSWLKKETSTDAQMELAYQRYSSHPNVEWIFTGEAKNFREKACPVAYWFNQAYKMGLLKGKYICTYYDDDIYYPQFMEKMAGYLDEHPEALAVRCTENRTQLMPDGSRASTPPLEANKEIMGGENMDCVVDGMQVMFRRGALDMIFEEFGELLPEDPDWNSCSHSDGVFFNRMSQVIDKLHAIPEALCEHRATPYSTFTPTK